MTGMRYTRRVPCSYKRPGTYNITFSVFNSRAIKATAQRQLVVPISCAAGEQVCADMVRLTVAHTTTGCGLC